MKVRFNMKKKFFLMVIAVIMFVGIANVYALTTNDETSSSDPNSYKITDTATLTVQNVTESNPEAYFNAYKILDAYYNASTNVVSYEFTDDFQTFLDQSSSYQNFTVDDYFELTSGDITSGSTITTSTADKLMSNYATYIRTNDISGTLMTTNGTTRTATLEAGAYLVLPYTRFTSDVYAVMLGNLDVIASNGAWVVNNETIVAKKSDVSFTFNVGDESDVFVESDISGPLLSFSIGEKFPFELIGQVPQFPMNAINKTYTFAVFFTEEFNLESSLDSIVVKDGDTTLTTSPEGIVTNASGNRVATISIESNPDNFNEKVLIVEFNTDYLTGQEVTITGEASLTDQANIGKINSLDATLEYSNDPYSDETHYALGDAFIYTFGLNVLKYDAMDTTPLDTPLVNAVFDIYSDPELKNKVGTVTTGENGIGTFNGLKYGTYYLKETKAPTGYQLLDDSIEVEVGYMDDVETYSSAPPSFPLATAYAPNRKVGLLPVTGSTGIILFTCIGVLTVGSGVGLLVYYKKKKKKEQNIEVI